MVLVISGLLLAIQLGKLRSELREVQTQQSAQRQREQELQQMLARSDEQGDALNQSLDRVNKALDRERTERGELEQEVARLKEQQTILPTYSLAEDKHIKGGGITEIAKITIPRGASFIRLRLNLFEDKYERYIVVLEDAGQQELRKVKLQSSHDSAVIVRLPSNLLAEGQYKLKLSGTNNNNDYVLLNEFSFQVIKK